MIALKFQKLLDKSEAMTLLCTKATTHWAFIKFCFNIPLVLTSSAMCIINSISNNASDIKIPNIIVNAISVLIISLNNTVRGAEKYENFKKLSQQFMILSQDIEKVEDMTIEQFNILLLKYDNLIADVGFEDIPAKIKVNVSKSFFENDRHIPIQLNGIIGSHKKRTSIPLVSIMST